MLMNSACKRLYRKVPKKVKRVHECKVERVHVDTIGVGRGDDDRFTDLVYKYLLAT